MYDEIGTHFSRTRQKTYGSASSNWPVTDTYLAKLKSGQRVLDIGCGNGKLVSGLPAQAGLPTDVEYTGTDFSQTLLAEAKKLHPDRDFRFGNVVDPEHWSGLGKFDAIFCVAVLHHIPEERQQLYVLKQVKEHLKQGGFVYLTVWNLWQEKFAQFQVDDHFEVPYNRQWRRYCVAFDIQSMTDLVQASGLDLQELYYADREGEKSDIANGQNLIAIGAQLAA